MVKNSKKILAVLAILTLIVTGTYAMYESIAEKNEFSGRKTAGEEGEPVLHDDFDSGKNMKDVYVENLGSTTLFVRIKLEEAMNLNDYTWRPENDDYIAHIYNPEAENCSHANSDGKYFHDYFTWNMGGWKYYKPAEKSGETAKDTKIYTENDFNNTELNILRTPEAKIITATEFLGMEYTAQKAFIGWIYDTDGYAYWSQPLRPGEVTGLLLHGVTTSPVLNNTDYYYVINVIAQAVDKDDIPMWTEGKESSDGEGGKMDEATDDGKEVIKIITGSDDTNGGDGGDNNGDKNGDNGDDGNGNDEPSDKVLAVKPPVDSEQGYRSHITGTREDESCWFTSRDKLVTAVLDEPGALRLEDILVNMSDVVDLKVIPVNPKYEGMFSIGSARTSTCPERADKLSILYTVIPDKTVAEAQWNADRDTNYPIITQLILETADGRTATITVTMEYRFGFVAWEY